MWSRMYRELNSLIAFSGVHDLLWLRVIPHAMTRIINYKPRTAFSLSAQARARKGESHSLFGLKCRDFHNRTPPDRTHTKHRRSLLAELRGRRVHAACIRSSLRSRLGERCACGSAASCAWCGRVESWAFDRLLFGVVLHCTDCFSVEFFSSKDQHKSNVWLWFIWSVDHSGRCGCQGSRNVDPAPRRTAMKKKKFCFSVLLEVLELNSIPYVNGTFFVKLRQIDGGDFGNESKRYAGFLLPCK